MLVAGGWWLVVTYDDPAGPLATSHSPLATVFLRLYLIVYFVLLAAAVFALWQGGVLERLPAFWVVAALALAAALGFLLAVVSRPRVGS